jgi:hypothetical protein
MHRPTFSSATAVLLAAAGLTSTARAQSPTLVCATMGATADTLGRRSLVNGYVVEIRRTGSDEYDCEAMLTDRAGREAYRTRGFGVRVDDSTGMDVDGDRIPELILYKDVGGGNFCCWTYDVISLKAPARLLFEFQQSGAAEFRRGPRGEVTLWSWEGGFMGPDGTMAGRLFAQRVYRYAAGRLAEVTPEYCDEIAADSSRAAPSPDPEALRVFQATGRLNDTTYELVGDIERLMLQHVFCHRFDAALAVARELWPAADRARFLASFRDMVSAAYKEYSAPLAGWAAGAEAERKEVEKGFRYVPDLVRRLGEYERDRGRYPTIASFYPRLLDVFDELSSGQTHPQ